MHAPFAVLVQSNVQKNKPFDDRRRQELLVTTRSTFRVLNLVKERHEGAPAAPLRAEPLRKNRDSGGDSMFLDWGGRPINARTVKDKIPV